MATDNKILDTSTDYDSIIYSFNTHSKILANPFTADLLGLSIMRQSDWCWDPNYQLQF